MAGATEVIRDVIDLLRRFLRRGSTGVRVVRRRAMSRMRVRGLASAGPGVEIEPGVSFLGEGPIALDAGVRLMGGATLWATSRGSIEIGPRTYVGNHSWVVANDSIRIGADVLIAPFCYIQDTDHGFEDATVPINRQPSNSSPIVIEDDVWLGAHAVVTRGVRIGRGAVVGAGSVVTRDIPAWTVAVGAPARPVRRRSGAPPAEGTAEPPADEGPSESDRGRPSDEGPVASLP